MALMGMYVLLKANGDGLMIAMAMLLWLVPALISAMENGNPSANF